jgi:UDP-N-acetylenolpyruvoylglucosamine reductase
MFRLLTDFVPEYGAVRVECGRNYKFVIDNSFSVFTKKEVKFGYKLSAIELEAKKAEEVRMPLDAKSNGQEEKVPDDEKENEKRMMNNGRMNGNDVGKMGML